MFEIFSELIELQKKNEKKMFLKFFGILESIEVTPEFPKTQKLFDVPLV